MKVVCAISGQGRTLANLIRLEQEPGSRFQIVGVISSAPNCPGNLLATQAGKDLWIGDFNRNALAATSQAMRSWLSVQSPDWVALCGFVKIFPIIPELARQTINIHPALLPRHGGAGMYGSRVHQAVLHAKDEVSGATVHFVSERYDEGPIIAQAIVPVKEGESAESLENRVFAAECKLYPQVINMLADGLLPLGGGRVQRYEYDTLVGQLKKLRGEPSL